MLLQTSCERVQTWCSVCAELQAAGVVFPGRVCGETGSDGPGHRQPRQQHPAGPEGGRRHRHRAERGNWNL